MYNFRRPVVAVATCSRQRQATCQVLDCCHSNNLHQRFEATDWFRKANAHLHVIAVGDRWRADFSQPRRRLPAELLFCKSLVQPLFLQTVPDACSGPQMQRCAQSASTIATCQSITATTPVRCVEGVVRRPCWITLSWCCWMPERGQKN